MPTNILMPALSPTMEKGNLARWLKKEGDRVRPGDVIAEIETDKATMEVEAIDEGVMAKIVVPDGTIDVPVNEVIAVIAGEGEDVASIKGAPVSTARAPARGSGEVAAAPPPAASPPHDATPSAAPSAEPARAMNGGKEPGRERLFASPLARRLAREGGIDLTRIQGSGPHGRVVARDVQAARESGAAAPKAAERPAAPTPAHSPPLPPPLPPLAPSDEKIVALFEPGSYEVVPHDSMRRIIAQRLIQAKQTIPHFYLTVDCVIDRLLAAREEINGAASKDKDGKPLYKLSVNDFVIKALALALQWVPDANVTWTEGGLLKHRHSDVGVAVAIPGGLMTPVVRRAETKPLSVISSEMKDFAARARNRRLKPEEYQGGSTAVSNLGMYGIKDFAAVINPPHATILAVGAGEQRAVVKEGALAIATVMSATLSTDHRAVDGALGSEFLAAFKRFIENPVEMLV